MARAIAACVLAAFALLGASSQAAVAPAPIVAPTLGGTPWTADEIAKLGAQHVLPDHSPIGDGSLIGQERTFLAELRDRALALKQRGESAEQAGQELTTEFKNKYPDWSIGDLTSFVKAAYND